MEILFFIVIALVILGIVMAAASPKETKLFRRVWSSEKAGASHAQGETIGKLYQRYNISIPKSADGADIENLGDSIGRLMEKATEFDLKNRNNLGVVVSSILARDLEFKLHMAGINDFDQQLMMLQNVDVGELAQAMRRAVEKL